MTKVVQQVYAVILVITLYHSDKCSSLSLPEEEVPVAVDNELKSSNPESIESVPEESTTETQYKNHVTNDVKSRDQSTYTVNLGDLFKELSIYNRIVNDVSSRYETKKAADEANKRVIRQAYPGYSTSLYPQLPTSPPYNQYQPYANYNQSPPQNQPGYPLPSDQSKQWHPTNTYNNYSQPGYPSNTYNYNRNNYSQSSGLSHNNSPNYPSYNTNQRVPPTGPYPPYNNPPSGSDYRPPNTGHTSNVTNYRPYGQFGNQQYHNNPYPATNNTVSYNPNQKPYPLGNQYFNPNQPNHHPYGPGSNHPVIPFNSTTQRSPYTLPGQYPSYNSSKPYPYYLPGNTPVTNTSYSNVPSGRPPYSPYGQNNYNYQHHGSGHGSANSTLTFNGSNQKWPNYPPPATNGNHPSQNNYSPGYQPHGSGRSPNNSTYPFAPNQYSPTNGPMRPPTTNYYPHNAQYNGTNTYSLVGTYNPSIPNQPPYSGNSDQRHFFYPPNRNGTMHDPTRASPELFSYHH